MFRVKRWRRWLISKSPFSRQCISRIRDTCSQLTWKSHSPHTHGGTFWPTLNPVQIWYPHYSCQNKPKSEVCKMATSPFDIRVASSSVILWYTQPVDMKLTYTLTHMMINGHPSSYTWVSQFPLTIHHTPYIIWQCPSQTGEREEGTAV